MQMIEAALQYAAAGIPVFPLHWIKNDGTCSCRAGANCQAKGKHPRIVNWCEEATTDEAKIKGWWQKAPNANIGIPMGEKSGLVALDVDIRHGGDKSLVALVLENEELPDTITATTGGGGKHYIFKYTDELALKNVVGVREGLDVRTQGGMIVAAPSVHSSGAQYTWDEGKSPFDIEAADMPAWLTQVIRNFGTAITKKASKPKAESDVQEKIREGGRNTHLASIAGLLRRRGLDEAAIAAALREENKSKVVPPLPDEDVARIAKSVARYDPEAEVKEFSLTDAGNAERFADMFQNQLKFCAAFNTWFIWNGKYWVKDEQKSINNYAIDVARSMIIEASTIADTDKRDALISHAKKSEQCTKIKACIELARGMPQIAVRPDELDNNLYLLNCENGTIDLRTGKIRPHDPKDLITKMCNTKYDANCQIPMWTQLLEKVTRGDKNGMQYIQRVLGYALTGDISEQAMFILYGTGSNGKSTLLNTFSELLGEYAAGTASDTFMQKKTDAVNNDIARLKGARFVTAIEMEENKRLSEPLIKSVTGGDKLVSRFLYGEYFEYVPHFKVFLAVNHKPIIRDTTHSIWRRLFLIPFTNTFTEQERDKNFASKLVKTELPGILAWAVQGCLMWQRSGLTPPDYVKTAVEEYREEMDSFSTFFSECCVESEKGRVSNKMLRARYDEWCKENGEYALSQRPFSQKLIERGYQKRNSGATGGMEWYGFALRGEASRL